MTRLPFVIDSRSIIPMLCAAVLMTPSSIRADALMVTRAMNATTVAEVFIEDDVVRVELEIGVSDLDGFRNLMPDEIYERLGHEPLPLRERLDTFFAEDLVIRADGGAPIAGELVELLPRPRIKRDEITGAPLPVDEENAEVVVFARLAYPLNGHPAQLSITPPTDPESGFVRATIGFVTYHHGLPINDFRYLSREETVDLDWIDPWYSQFQNRNLRRQFNAPLSAYIYVDQFEVRKEIVVRPIDLQSWIDLGLEGAETIPIADQDELKQRVADYLIGVNPVTIDGERVEPVLDRIHFIRRSLRRTGIVDPPEDLAVVSATLGIIFVYPVQGLPDEVTMTWEMFNERISRVPTTATDEAGGLPFEVSPDDPVLTWTNYLTNPSQPSFVEIAPPVRSAAVSVPVPTLILVIGAMFTAALMISRRRRESIPNRVSLAGLLIAAAALWTVGRVTVSNPLAGAPTVADEDARAIVNGLLRNVYRAFDYRDEGVIYDTLQRSASGDLLTQIYLETRRALELQNQGGARAKVTDVEMLAAQTTNLDDETGFVSTCKWNVTGSVGHWGHLHQRRNRYEAVFTVKPVGGVWKIVTLEVLAEQRL